MLGRILNAIEETGTELPSLRHLSYGGGRMPLELVERTLTDMPHIDLVNAYGLTETSSTIAMLTPDEHREAFASDEPGHPGAARLGRASPSVPRGGGARHRRRACPGGREGRNLGARRAGGRRVRRQQRADRRRLVPHPGCRLVRRARLPLRRRPARRRDRARGGEHLARRDRRGAHAAHRRRRGCGHRHPRRRVGRGGGGGRRPAPQRRRRPRPTCRSGSRSACAPPKCRASSLSATSSPTRRRASCCDGCCGTSCPTAGS